MSEQFTNPESPELPYGNINDELIAVCTECLTQIPDSVAENDVFLRAGHSGVCRYCQGPTVITGRSAVEQMKRKRAQGKLVNPKN